jgi:hypothetical protein
LLVSPVRHQRKTYFHLIYSIKTPSYDVVLFRAHMAHNVSHMPRSRICGATKLSPVAAANAGFKARILAKRLWGMMRCCMPLFISFCRSSFYQSAFLLSIIAAIQIARISWRQTNLSFVEQLSKFSICQFIRHYI